MIRIIHRMIDNKGLDFKAPQLRSLAHLSRRLMGELLVYQ